MERLAATAKLTCALSVEAVHDLVEHVKGISVHIALCAAHSLLKHVPNELGVAGAHHQPEAVLVLGLHLFLLLVLLVAVPKQVDDECHETYLQYDAAIPHDQCHQGTGDEGYAGCDEPTTDDAQHTSDTEHGTLTTPCTVGKT